MIWDRLTVEVLLARLQCWILRVWSGMDLRTLPERLGYKISKSSLLLAIVADPESETTVTIFFGSIKVYINI